MKKAVLYARVSTENQQKEGTIQSQVVELKRQVIEAGDVLVKEYVDDGHSGAKLDRPALSQLRADLKTNLFDTVYFLNTDRIARDVTYQNIIVAEILKYKKQIIINGKDYIHNPENKFELTVLGAVSELERAKIIERSLRGKIHRLRQGFMLGNGYNIYGYTFIPRSQDIPSKLIVVEKQAKVVKQIFEMYAIQEASWATIIRSLEENGSITQMGKKHWPVHALMRMLRNSTYSGIKYFNTRRLVKEPSHSLRGIKYGKKVFRDRSEWIGVKVPAIVPKELFDKAQVRLDESKNKYRHPRQIQLLSNFMRCGECDRFCVAYQRYLRHYHKKDGKLIRRTENVYHKVAYKCNRRHIERVHIKSLDIKRCNNPEVSAKVIEPFVFKIKKICSVSPN